MPLQQKLVDTTMKYEPNITILTLLPIIDKVCRKVGVNDLEQPADKLNYVLAAIVAETTGTELDTCEKSLLDRLSSCVAWHYHEALERNSLQVAS